VALREDETGTEVPLPETGWTIVSSYSGMVRAKALETISTGYGELGLAGAGEGHRDQKLWSVTWVTLWISECGWMVPFGDASSSSGFRITEVICRI